MNKRLFENAWKNISVPGTQRRKSSLKNRGLAPLGGKMRKLLLTLLVWMLLIPSVSLFASNDGDRIFVSGYGSIDETEGEKSYVFEGVKFAYVRQWEQVVFPITINDKECSASTGLGFAYDWINGTEEKFATISLLGGYHKKTEKHGYGWSCGLDVGIEVGWFYFSEYIRYDSISNGIKISHAVGIPLF